MSETEAKSNIENDSAIQPNGDIKEEFCGACMALPLALVGAGAAGAGAKGGHSKTKTIMLWGGIALTLISLAVAIYFITRCKTCR